MLKVRSSLRAARDAPSKDVELRDHSRNARAINVKIHFALWQVTFGLSHCAAEYSQLTFEGKGEVDCHSQLLTWEAEFSAEGRIYPIRLPLQKVDIGVSGCWLVEDR